MTAILCEVVPHDQALERARAGDHEAFAELIERHEAMVFSLGYHFFRDRGRAEEIAQDVFLQLYRNLRDIESPAHLLFWLRQVTSRRCIDVARKARLRLVSVDDTLELPSPASLSGSSDPLLGRRLRQSVSELTEMQRLVVTLRYQEDLDPTEICKIVGLPVNTVKSHLHRALAALRKKLGDQS